jgi:hypothetical protein
MSTDRPPPASNSLTLGTRLLIFGLVGALTVAAVVAFALHRRAQLQISNATNSAPVIDGSRPVAETRRQPHLLFRNTALGPAYGHVAMVPLSAVGGVRFVTPVIGDRVYGSPQVVFVLRAFRSALTTYEAESFGGDFRAGPVFKLAGAPSRTRVSPSGRLAASTVFITGDSYNSGGFSTRTTLFDLAAGKVLGDLEDFNVEKDGRPFKNQDFNFWGVTFAADDDRFYATLASGNVPYLIEGSVARRTARVIREVVECPSLSPDGTRVVFKSRLTENGRRLWHLHVLDLKSLRESAVHEDRNVDDQAEWLDDTHLLYTLPRGTTGGGHADIWVVPADGTGVPALFVSDASSPCVVRP